MTDNSRVLRRRRGREFVTQNACNECKKKKAKVREYLHHRLLAYQACSAMEKVPVQGVHLFEIVCEYSIPIHVSKLNMRTRIAELEVRLEHSERTRRLLSGETHSASVSKQSGEGERTERIYQVLVEEQLSDSKSIPCSQEGRELSSQLSETGSKSIGESALSSGTQEESVYYSGNTWTVVTTNVELVKQLHSLYFSWEHALYSLFSKNHFIADRERGRQRYCSPLLVNVIAALGCKFSSLPEIKRDFDNGAKFYLEAERIWETEQSDTSITTIQATALMSLWEASQGQHNRGAFYSRQALSMAVEVGLHKDSTLGASEEEVRSATFWGIFALDQIWSLTKGRLPHLSTKGTFNIPPLLMDGQDQLDWAPYFDERTQLDERRTQTSNVRSLFRGICELSHIIYESLYVLYSPKGSFTSRDVMEVYGKYLKWYDSMLQVLKSGENSTPTAIFAHLLYHYGLLFLFSPLIGLQLYSSIEPSEMCTQAANAASSLVCSYRQLYSLNRVHSFIPYISLASSIAHLIIARTQGPMASGILPKVAQGIAALRDMAPSSAFAGRAADAIRKIADRSVRGAEPLPSGGETLPGRSEGAIYSLENAPDILSHQVLAQENSTFLSYLSQALAEVTSDVQVRLRATARTSEISTRFAPETPRMTELEAVLAELEMSHHLKDIIEQGFDTWDALLDIGESDLDALGVKLGHRRRLQRKIASQLGWPPLLPLQTGNGMR